MNSHIPILYYVDDANQTIKQTTERNTKGKMNVKGDEKPMIYYDDDDKQTIKQTTERNTKGRQSQESAPFKTADLSVRKIIFRRFLEPPRLYKKQNA